MKHNKVTIFDFCETLVDIQSADAFVDFVMSDGVVPNNFFRVSYFKFVKLLVQLRFYAILKLIIGDNSLEKAMRLFSLKGLTKEYLESKTDKFIVKLNDLRIIPIWNILQNSLNSEDSVIICSGGYDIYLKKIFLGMDVRVECTEFSYKENRFTGFWNGTDCLGSEKSRRLEKLKRPQEAKEITVYTDSSTDLPLLKLATKGVVVGKGNCPKWAMEFDYLKWA